jgi:hypothetical protein
VFLIGAALLLSIASSPSSSAQAGASTLFNANSPSSSGYKMTFDDEFDSLASIDVNGTGKPGYKWYTTQFFGGKTTPPSCLSVHGGVLTINGYGNGAIETASPSSNSDGYVGTVFGGGAYFEASIAFDPKLVDTKVGWPSFWSMAIEHMALKGKDQWDGQMKGYARFIEVDFFEDDTSAWAGVDTYGGAVHDTYGQWTKEKGYSMVSNPNFVVRVPKGTDFTKFHRYGCLVVPALQSNGWCGFIQYYFDGLPTSDLMSWTGNQGAGTPPPSGDQKFESADKAHLNVLLGCGTGQKMRVDYVHVWQPAQTEKQ